MFRKSEDIFEDEPKSKKEITKFEKKQNHELEKERRRQEKQDEINAKAAKKASEALEKAEIRLNESKNKGKKVTTLFFVLHIIGLLLMGIVFVLLLYFMKTKQIPTSFSEVPFKMYLYLLETECFLIVTYAYFRLKKWKSFLAGILSVCSFLSIFYTYFYF